jgi:hypothetical protein
LVALIFASSQGSTFSAGDGFGGQQDHSLAVTTNAGMARTLVGHTVGYELFCYFTN